MCNFFKISILFVSICLVFSNDMIIDSLASDYSQSLSSADSLEFLEDNLFEQLLTESKLFYADAIIADLKGDTLNTLYHFDNLFKALAQLEEISKNVPDIVKVKYQNLLSASIEYYDNKVSSVDHTESGLSTAVFKDKLEQYIYSQNLEDIMDIEETVEIIPGHVPITYNKKVASIIKYYQNQGRPHIQRWLNRESKYKEIILPIFVIIGYQARIASGTLAVFCLMTAFIFHFDFSNQSQLVSFLKNIGLAGGFLFLVVNGAKGYCLDKK